MRSGKATTILASSILLLGGACTEPATPAPDGKPPDVVVFFEPPSGWRVGRAFRSPADSSVVALAATPRESLISLGTSEAQLLTSSSLRPVAAGWSPDGGSLVLADSPLGRPAAKGDDLVVLSTTGEILSRVRPTRPVGMAARLGGEGSIMMTSPTEALLAVNEPSPFYGWTRLAAIDLTTGDVRWITGPNDGWRVTAFTPLEDGGFVVAEVLMPTASEPPEASRLRIVDAGGRTLHQRMEVPGMIDSIVPLSGNKLLIGGLVMDGQAALGLWLIDDALSADPRQLPFSDLRWPTAGPSSNEFLATRIEGPGETNQVVRVSLDEDLLAP